MITSLLPTPRQTLASLGPFPSILLPCVWGGSSPHFTEVSPSLFFFLSPGMFPAQEDRKKQADPPMNVYDSGSKFLRGSWQGELLRAGGPLPGQVPLLVWSTYRCGAARLWDAHTWGWVGDEGACCSMTKSVSKLCLVCIPGQSQPPSASVFPSVK